MKGGDGTMKFSTILAIGCILIAGVLLSGCSLLGGACDEPVLQFRSPVKLTAVTASTEIPPANQRAVFSAPVQAVAAPQASAAAYCPPNYDVLPEPVLSARRYSLEK
jgi:hypothetical protein